MENVVQPATEKIYVTRLTPYRSLTPLAFRRFIIGFCCVNFALSLPFFFMGAWPVAGFMGLDALALYVAFKINFRSAGAYETIDVTPLELVFEKVSIRGQRKVWRFNPSWVRLEQEVHEEFGTERVALVTRGESVEIGGFLGPEQKAALARDLTKALSAARRGPRFD
ncbi:MAG: DUF2244 domain-containing protein [Methylocystis sp.]|jgi:uncharacterized membrane protein